MIASDSNCNQLIADDSKCPRNPIQSESESESESNPNTNRADKPPRSRFEKPTVADVEAYCIENGYSVDAQHFVDYYDSNGWKVGKNPMKDWKATVRSWASRDAKPKQKTSNPFLRLIEEGKLNDAE